MKKLLTTLSLSLLAGCASQEVITMQDKFVQPLDLRDLDNDGVIEAREACSDTLPGAAVDNVGCPSDSTYTTSFRLDVKFANDSADLKPSNYARLEQLAAFLQDQTDANVVIEGHASKVGEDDYNLDLSQRRAKTVAMVLVNDYGIPASRVDAVGYGETVPLLDEDTEYAHGLNRRVMATLSGSYDETDMRWHIFTAD